MDAAKPRIESLNPLVTVETVSSLAILEQGTVEGSLRDVDIVCITDADRDTMVSNSSARNADITDT